MDLIVLLLVVALVGFIVYLITTKIPMPPYWALALQIVALIIIVLFLLRQFGLVLPNVLR
jgi:hypothetical protein